MLNGRDLVDAGAQSRRDFVGFISWGCPDMERIGGFAPFSTCRWTYFLPIKIAKFVPPDEVSTPCQKQASVDIGVFVLRSSALIRKAYYRERCTVRIFDDREYPYGRNFFCCYQNTTAEVPYSGDQRIHIANT